MSTLGAIFKTLLKNISPFKFIFMHIEHTALEKPYALFSLRVVKMFFIVCNKTLCFGVIEYIEIFAI